MEAPSSRFSAARAGPQKAATRNDSDGDSEPDAAGDIKTHFRVCRFMMETGTTELLGHEEFKFKSFHFFSF